MVETQIGFDTSSCYKSGFMSIGLESLRNIGYSQHFFLPLESELLMLCSSCFFRGECGRLLYRLGIGAWCLAF